ncbi:MAG TPA: tRNA (adenosine(37)-N6)-dimethylallyltransferase MiaA [Gammaproteobacteria bacterium]|nr:tRNA (adenosine(37)-N6)-dimethylallyltransferase MiaA [Gammaproteobacteria bacterium]
MTTKAPALFLMGPTATGKTKLAIEMVQRYPFEIVSVDSTMVYKGMDIGSAKPSAAELAQAPHRLINICELDDIYSAGRFCEDALQAIQEIQLAGKIPLLVGGTMLYYRSLEFGLAEMPQADAETKQRLQQEMAQLGSVLMHRRLAEVDAESAKRIHPNDPQRISRALEVYAATGIPLAEYHQLQKHTELPFQPVKLGLMCHQRAELHQRIELRFQQMMAAGFLDEVKSFFDNSRFHGGLPAMRSVGYRQLCQHLAGETSIQEAVAKGIIATRQLAKRQMTWLRSWPDLICVDAMSEDYAVQAIKLLNQTPIADYW